jgi:hypothetical protein
MSFISAHSQKPPLKSTTLGLQGRHGMGRLSGSGFVLHTYKTIDAEPEA